MTTATSSTPTQQWMRTTCIFLRLENVDPAGWPSTSPSGDARYKWWIDTNGGDMVQSGGNMVNAEYMAMVEDLTLNSADPTLTRDQLGEMTLLDDLLNTGFTTRWDSTSPPKYTTNTPTGAPSPSTTWRRVLGAGTAGAGGPQGIVTDPFIGYRVTGNFVDMYISRARIGNPGAVCAVWATDNQDNNMDRAPACDRTETTCLQVITPTPTPTNTPTNTLTPTPTRPPTGIRMSGLRAQRRVGGVDITWETASEADVTGFDVLRAGQVTGPFERINEQLIAATGSAAAGGSYSLTDDRAPAGRLVYRVEALDAGGKVVSSHDTVVSAERATYRLFLPLAARPAAIARP